MIDPSGRSEQRPAAGFATTQWSIVLGAARTNPQDAELALAALCKSYWFPLYAYVRRRGIDGHEAQDLTQEFFARLLDKDILAAATPDRGRFRSFLLTAMKNFLANEWNKSHAQKRGGRGRMLSLDFDSGDSRLSLEPAHDMTPERLYERAWAITLLDLVLNRLREEYVADANAQHFDQLRPFIGGNRSEASYAEVAEALQMSEGAAKVAAHRLRKRYRDLLRSELAQTIADPTDVDEEIAWLFQALG